MREADTFLSVIVPVYNEAERLPKTLRRLHEYLTARPFSYEILLVLDAATVQEAVNVATHFDQSLNITGSILTKLDGDARWGAALSIGREVAGKQADGD